jgi:hypothetical protein
MSTDYRALCALCAELLADYDNCFYPSELSNRAHAELARWGNYLVKPDSSPATNPVAVTGEVSERLRQIGHQLRTQDNRCAANPIFQVRGLMRYYGIDPSWTDDPVWIDTEDGAVEVDPPEDPGNPGEFIIQVGYLDVWEVLMVAFTEEGCKKHLELNGHNYRRYRKVEIYADNIKRCPEMFAIREFLLGLPVPQAEEVEE